MPNTHLPIWTSRLERAASACLQVLLLVVGGVLVAAAVVYGSTRSGFSREMVTVAANIAALGLTSLGLATLLHTLARGRAVPGAGALGWALALCGALLTAQGLALLATRLLANGFTLILMSRVLPLLALGLVSFTVAALMRGVGRLVRRAADPQSR
jgi:hypothetical protein